ncbi:uncharacterized protein EAE98_007743 [Botrytis deweyae]|uniref:EKC/KEOPS complex subunit BUD32 n=1 Tax=Botrytis deweyae TaxID=2478750 RepID=A0ABQ7IFV3_9HELO|nr:uncharacterized protein EAE98_007743 [Botrytis deweyae]KAF7923038.1 hypothetical protein EAE98_007743 [Botrytis deweyae]
MNNANIQVKHVESTDDANAHSNPKHPKPMDDVKFRVQPVETNYGKGGFHPIHLEDTFKHDRYKVIHKLGHGGFATVWLARDTKRERYVALKVLAARLSSTSKEVDMLRQMKSSPEHDGRFYVMSLLDHFTHKGPNGDHLCLVSEVGGPSIRQFNSCPGEYKGSRRLEASVARNVCLQAIQGLKYIHSTGVVHGDVTPANILLQLANIDEWTEEQIYERLGVPQKKEIIYANSKLPVTDSSFPDYTVAPINMKEVNPKWIANDIIIIDFGIAFLQTAPSFDLGTPKSYCAPEFLFGCYRSVASDIWALGCTIFEIRTGSRLFRYDGIPNRDEMLIAAVRLLGAFPDEWWAAWKEGLKWYEQQTEIDARSAGNILDQILQTGTHDGDSPPHRQKLRNAALEFIEQFKERPRNDMLDGTDQLVEMAEKLRTSEAEAILKSVNAIDQGISVSHSNKAENGSTEESPSNPKSSEDKSSEFKSSKSKSSDAKSFEANSSDAKSSEKTPSSEGLSTGRSPKKSFTKFSALAEKPKTKTSANVPDSEDNETQSMAASTEVERCGPEHSHSYLEPSGIKISTAEARILEDLLRKTLRYLPEERSTALELSKHIWFSDISKETD